MTELARAGVVDRTFPFEARDFERVRTLIHQRAGISLAEHKRDMVYSRLVRRVRAGGFASFAAYLDALERGDDGEWQDFINALTTNLTSFFREAYHFDALIAQLREAAAREGTAQPLRIWCAAASTGEEPWSLAITACEAFGTLAPPVRILATDIDTQVLATAEAGIYTLDRIEALSDERRRAYFQRGAGPHEGMCRVRRELRDLVAFRPLNLLDRDYGIAPGLTAIFCRNVMIYFDNATKTALIDRFIQSIKPGGFLYIGHSESFHGTHPELQLIGRTTYRRKA